jgi:hypothetical protein
MNNKLSAFSCFYGVLNIMLKNGSKLFGAYFFAEPFHSGSDVKRAILF